MDSIYDPAEIYDTEFPSDDDYIDDNKSDKDDGESNRIDSGSKTDQDASDNKLSSKNAAENSMVDNADTDDGSTVLAEEAANRNEERFKRTEGDDNKVSVMQRLSPSIYSRLNRDSARGGKSRYNCLIMLNLPYSYTVDQLKEFINTKLDSGITLEKVEGIYVGAAMVWITPVSAIGEVVSSLKVCVLEDKKVVCRKVSLHDQYIFARKKAESIAGPKLGNRYDGAPAERLWQVELRNINTSLSGEQLDSIFRKRAEGVVKVIMIGNKKLPSNKKHSGRGYVTLESRALASRFCTNVSNTIVGGRNVVARMQPNALKGQMKRSPDPSRAAPKEASKQAPKLTSRPPHYRLTITGVSVEVSAKELEEIFSGEVSSPVCAHLTPMEGAQHAGTGYLEFQKEEAARTAHTLLNGTDIGGSCITLSLDIDKGSEPKEQEQLVAEGNSSDVMEISIQKPEQDVVVVEEEKRPRLAQRSRSRDSDSRRERDHRNLERKRRDPEREWRHPRENDRSVRQRSRSPLRSGRSANGQQIKGVTIYRNLEELLRKTRGVRYRAHVSNIAYTMTEEKLISLFNQIGSGLEGLLSIQNDEGKFKGIMILEFVSPSAVEVFMEKMASFRINGRKIVIKRDSANTLRDCGTGLGRGRQNSPQRSRDDRPRHRDMSPIRPQHQMAHNPHMGPDHMMRPNMQLGPMMPSSMGHPSQMGGMSQMMPGMDNRMNPVIGMAGNKQMGGPAFGPGQQMAGGFGMNRSLGGVSSRLGEMMDQSPTFMPSQQPPVVVVPETSQQQLVPLPATTGDANTETYGLSMAFLSSLNIKLPLVKELLVINLDSAATDADIKDLFTIAGTVTKIQYNQVKGQAIVEMTHPVEAVQALSMLHNQEYFDRVLVVRMLRLNDPDNLVTRAIVPAIPRGLKTIGKGLGIDGLPVSTVLQPPVVPPPQQLRHPQKSVIPDLCMQRPPSFNKGSEDQRLFPFPPPLQLPHQNNGSSRRGQTAGFHQDGRGGRGDNHQMNTSRRDKNRTESTSRWQSMNASQKSTTSDTRGIRRDSGGVDRDRQDDLNSSKNRFRDSVGDKPYSQSSIDRLTDIPPQHYGSIDANRKDRPPGRNDPLAGDMKEGFGGGGRKDDQFNKTNNSWQNDHTDFENTSFGNQSDSGRFSINVSSNGERNLGQASRDGSSWDGAGRSGTVKLPNSYETDEQSRNYSSDGQNRDHSYNNRSGGYANSGGDSLNASKSKFSHASAIIATHGSGSRGSSLLSGYVPAPPSGDYGSESLAMGASSSSTRSLLTDVSSSTSGREVILSNLPSSARELTIADMCMPYGVVRSVVHNSAQRSGRVVFDSYEQATMAADILNNQDYNGTVLSAMLA